MVHCGCREITYVCSRAERESKNFMLRDTFGGSDTIVPTLGHFLGGSDTIVPAWWDVPPHPCFGWDGRNFISALTCTVSEAPLSRDTD